MGSRRVLMVSYWYPPTPGAGAERAAGFARHLRGYGWDPVILTAKSESASLSARLFGIGEFSAFDGSSKVYRVPDLVGASAIQSPYAGPPLGAAREHWLKRFVFPDRFAIWAGRAEREARYELGEDFPEVVWATFPPASAAMVGGKLAKTYSRPLVLDFRDPWFGAGGYLPRSERQRELHEDLERRLARQAAAIVVISEAMRDDVCRRLVVEPDRVHVVTNGFDLVRCEVTPASESGNGGEIVHIGSVSQRNRPDLFLNTLANVARQGTLPGRVRFIGNLSAEYVASLGLTDWVSTYGMMPWDAAWRDTCSATALLLLVGDYVGQWGHNTKLFEYLRSGRPILCLEEREKSNDRRLLEELASPRSVFGSLGDPASIVSGMASAIQLGRGMPFGTLDGSDGLVRYDRRRLTAQLSEILDAVAASR